MNDDRACEIVRLLDSIDTTLRAMLARQCECAKITNVHNEFDLIRCADSGTTADEIRAAVRRAAINGHA